MQDGDQVLGQVTLDNCGYRFTTEAEREARRQYDVLDSSSAPTGVSNELVAYDSPADAALAVSQWFASAAHCPHTAVRSTVEGVPPLVMRIIRNDRDLSSLPVADNAVTVESGTAAGQGTLYNVSILQASGRYLDDIYLTADQPITADEMTTALDLAATTGYRLAALT